MGPKKHPLQTAQDQALDAASRRVVCPCGVCRRCVCRRAQAKYRRTAKGKATAERYSGSATRRATDARYRATERGRRATAKTNARRIFAGRRYHGHAQTIEQASAINAHVKERIRAFERQQAGTEAEGA